MADYAPPGISAGGTITGALTVTTSVTSGFLQGAFMRTTPLNGVVISENAGGGVLGLLLSGAAPGASARWQLAIVAGSVSGGKLIAVSPAGTVTTILDNMAP